MTSTEMLRALGLCVACGGDNHVQPGSETCGPCDAEAEIMRQAIAAVHAGTSNPTVRDVMERSLRDFAGLVTGRQS